MEYSSYINKDFNNLTSQEVLEIFFTPEFSVNILRDPYARKCFDMLMSGISPYQVIEMLLETNSKLNDELIEIHNNGHIKNIIKVNVDDIIDFDADIARELSRKYVDVEELNEILIEIKKHIKLDKKGCYVVCKPLKSGTINKLTKKGFKVKPAPSIATQKDNVYYFINW